MENISPEEHLLRLIRSGQQKSFQKQQQPSQNAPGSSATSLIHKAGLALSFNLMHRLALRAFLIMAVYLLLDSLITNAHKLEESVLRLGALQDADLEQSAAALPQPVSYYSQPVKAKNLFAAISPKTRGGLPSSTFMDIVSNLTLQGIISGVDPQAIIQDKKSRQTYYLSPGERIGEIEVGRILPGKVILIYYGQEAELGL